MTDLNDDQRAKAPENGEKAAPRDRARGRAARQSPYSRADLGDTTPIETSLDVSEPTVDGASAVREQVDVDSPAIAVFDRAAALLQLKLATATDDALGEYDVPVPGAASSEEQTRIERLRALVTQHVHRPLVVGDAAMRNRVSQLRFECPAFAGVASIIERAVTLSMATATGLSFPPIVLIGPPGVGKTHFERRLTAALDCETYTFSCATNSDAQALIAGHPPTWRGARMGVLTEAMLGGETANPVIILDEVDKFVTHVSERPFNSLLTLLEPENASALVDEYLRVSFDLSRCLIIATANDLNALPRFIQDRFLIIEIAPPDGKMLREIAQRIAAEIIANHRQVFAPVDDAVIGRLAQANPRHIRRLMVLALGFAAAQGRRHLDVADVAAAEACMAPVFASRPIGFLGAHHRVLD